MSIESRIVPSSTPLVQLNVPTDLDPPNFANQIRKLNGEDSLKLLGDGEVQKLYRDYFKEATADIHRLIHAGFSYDKKIQRQVDLCEPAVQLKRFLEKGELSRFLPGSHESLAIQFPDLDQDPHSTKWEFVDLTNNKAVPLPGFYVSSKEAAAICTQQKTADHFLNWQDHALEESEAPENLGRIPDDSIVQKYESYAPLSELQELIAQKYRAFDALYEDHFTYDRFKEIMNTEAVEQLTNPEHEQRWNQTRDRIEAAALKSVRENQEALHNQILSRLQTLCQVEENPENHSIKISNCTVATMSNETGSLSSILALGLFGILLTGGIYALWTGQRQKKTDSLKDQILQLSSASSKIRQDFLAKLDDAIKSSNQSEQLKDDRARLTAIFDGSESEWSRLSPEFKVFLHFSLGGFSGYFNAIYLKLSQAGNWLRSTPHNSLIKI